MIYFRPLYDNHSIYGGFNKSKSTLVCLGKQKADKLNCIDNSLQKIVNSHSFFSKNLLVHIIPHLIGENNDTIL